MKMTREQQIELMEGAQKRADDYLSTWLSRPEVRAFFRKWMADLKSPTDKTGGGDDHN